MLKINFLFIVLFCLFNSCAHPQKNTMETIEEEIKGKPIQNLKICMGNFFLWC